MGKNRHRHGGGDGGGDSKRQKKANGEGEYPPAHVLESQAFESYYKECGVVPEAEWEAKDAEEREELLALELWLPEKQAEWIEERRLQQLEARKAVTQSNKYKQYKRFMKKQ